VGIPNILQRFASSILGTNGQIGDTFPCYVTGFTPKAMVTLLERHGYDVVQLGADPPR